MRTRRRISQPAHFSNSDENLTFAKATFASWTARMLTKDLRPTEDTLEFLMWLVIDTEELKNELINMALTEADKTRLLPDIKRGWNNPSKLAQIVGMALDRAAAGRLKSVSLEIADLLSGMAKPNSHSLIAKHLNHTKELFGLSTQELEFSFLFASMQWYEPVRNFLDLHLEMDKPIGRIPMMTSLDLTHSDMAKILSGKLFKIGIVDSDRSYLSIDSDFVSYFVDPNQSAVTQNLFCQAKPTDLSMSDLGLPPAEVEHLKDLLLSLMETPLHILLYGKPGTGKSTLSRSLMSELGINGFEVLGMNGNSRTSRRAALAASLEITTGQPNSCLIIDEADTLLSTSSPWFRSGEVLEKAWINEILEKPNLRCIWIVNSHEEFDPAVLRRFTYSLEMKPLGRKSRINMLDGVLRRRGIKRHFSTEYVKELAESFDLTPATFDTAAMAAQRVQTTSSKCRHAFRQTMVAKAKLTGIPSSQYKIKQTTNFLQESVNTSIDLKELETRVRNFEKRFQSTSNSPGPSMLGCLFHGAPGCGKSITARHLAETIDRPVLSFKSSDLINPYVGVTEQKIAEAFHQAASEEAVMIVDEVDTFLRARSSRNNRWESSMVNEFLVQLENFQGIIICTTNRLKDIDQAAIRRFPLKVEFNYLRPNQILETYHQILSPLIRSHRTQSELTRLESMLNVATADLFLVRNNILSYGNRNSLNHSDLIDAIQQEIDIKNPSLHQFIGF